MVKLGWNSVNTKYRVSVKRESDLLVPVITGFDYMNIWFCFLKHHSGRSLWISLVSGNRITESHNHRQTKK